LNSCGQAFQLKLSHPSRHHLPDGVRWAAGLTDVTIRTYPGARHEILDETNRHEILDETNRNEVVAELTTWLDPVVSSSSQPGRLYGTSSRLLPALRHIEPAGSDGQPRRPRDQPTGGERDRPGSCTGLGLRCRWPSFWSAASRPAALYLPAHFWNIQLSLSPVGTAATKLRSCAMRHLSIMVSSGRIKNNCT
jgi:hypothetical protein